MPNERPPDGDDRDREQRRLERLIPEIVRRVVEAGYEKLTEGPENVRQIVSDLKLPKEALNMLLTQIDESKNGLYRAVAREVRDFLDNTNFAEELAKALTSLSFEIKTEVRFIPNDARIKASPEVRTKMSVRRDRPSHPPSESHKPTTEAPPPPREKSEENSE
ncbi:MAG TPA: hypothetical protein VFQ61_35810 [Polyangiaceae bacterium]|nr:hypothetical protein [Polyangiaceae bacterium]